MPAAEAPSRAGTFRAAVVGTVCLVPVGLLYLLTALYTVELPFWDEWQLVPIAAHVERTGDIRPILTGAQKEHRKPIPNLIHAALAPATHGSVRTRTLINASVGVLLLACVLTVLRSSSPAMVPPLCVAASWLLLSPSQYGNWLWGLQLCVYLSALFSILGWRAIVRGGGGRRIAEAMGWGAAATLSFGSGALYWPTALYLCWRRADGRMAAGMAAGLLCAGVLAGYDAGTGRYTPSHLSNDWVMFVLNFIGSALGAGSAPWAAAAVLGYMVMELAAPRNPDEKVADYMRTMILFALLCSLVAASLRVERSGSFGGLAPRYVTYSSLLWTGVVALMLLRTRSMPSALRRAGVYLAVAIIVFMGVRAGWRALPFIQARHTEYTELRRVLLEGRWDDERLVLRVHPHLDRLRSFADEARRRGYSPYLDQRS
ncbi:MAG: hypothetical protein MOGMAGMI_02187 [Candidatus Omnitrophica bacterium]|nr:hypothetical protein [Candidatus Omnitrophota bacterium]